MACHPPSAYAGPEMVHTSRQGAGGPAPPRGTTQSAADPVCQPLGLSHRANS